jgi:MFS family permease
MGLWALGLAVFGYGVEFYNVPMALAGAVMAGIASAFYHPLESAALALSYGGRSGYAMGINGAMGSLGRSLYPAISTALFALLASKCIGLACHRLPGYVDTDVPLRGGRGT